MRYYCKQLQLWVNSADEVVEFLRTLSEQKERIMQLYSDESCTNLQHAFKYKPS